MKLKKKIIHYVLIGLLAGCGISSSQFEDTNLTLENADYPALIYHEQFQTVSVNKNDTTSQVIQQIQHRSKTLKHRVNLLKQSRINPTTRKQLSNGVARN